LDGGGVADMPDDFLTSEDTERQEDYLSVLSFVMTRQLPLKSDRAYLHIDGQTVEDYFETILNIVRASFHSAMKGMLMISEHSINLPWLIRTYYEFCIRYFLVLHSELINMDMRAKPVFNETPKLIKIIGDAYGDKVNIKHLRHLWGLLSNYSHCNIPWANMENHKKFGKVTLMTSTYLYELGSARISMSDINYSIRIQYYYYEMWAFWFCVERMHEYIRCRKDNDYSPFYRLEMCALAFAKSHESISQCYNFCGGPFSFAGSTLTNPDYVDDNFRQSSLRISDLHRQRLPDNQDLILWEMPEYNALWQDNKMIFTKG
jgi:hypothetical protein